MTTTFADASGRTWTPRVTWAAIRRSVALGVDLSLVEDHLGDFHRGSVKLVDALWAVLSPDAELQKVSREEFEQQITGETLGEALDALLAGLRDFFPSQRSQLIERADADVKNQLEKLLALPNTSTESPAALE